ncbi:MAG: hypothetical protein AAGI88_15510 [Pseudomonadota bacterium]
MSIDALVLYQSLLRLSVLVDAEMSRDNPDLDKIGEGRAAIENVRSTLISFANGELQAQENQPLDAFFANQFNEQFLGSVERSVEQLRESLRLSAEAHPIMRWRATREAFTRFQKQISVGFEQAESANLSAVEATDSMQESISTLLQPEWFEKSKRAFAQSLTDMDSSDAP